MRLLDICRTARCQTAISAYTHGLCTANDTTLSKAWLDRKTVTSCMVRRVCNISMCKAHVLTVSFGISTASSVLIHTCNGILHSR